MKKILLLTIFVLLLMSLSSLATDTRVLTMGENNTILLDDANIWLFPSRINNYPDLVFAEVSYGIYKNDKQYGDYTEPITRMGINWKFGGDKPWVLGTYFHNNDYYDEFPYGEQSIFPSWSIMPWHGPYYGSYENQSYSNRRLDLFWGYMMGENLLGVHFGYTHSSDKDEDLLTPSISLNERGFGKYDFLVGLTMMEGKLDLAAGIELFTFTYKNTANEGSVATPEYVAYDVYKPEGNNMITLRGRYFYEYNPTYTFVPHGEIMFGKFEHNYYEWRTDHDTLVYNRKYNWTSFDLGVGMHYVPTNNVLGVIDFGFMYVNLKQEYTDELSDPVEMDEYKTNYTVLPYVKLGMEADVFKWLDIRFGATTYWTKYNYEVTPYADSNAVTLKDIEKYPFNNTYLGLGFNFNRLHVDCYVDPEQFLDGFYFISGVDSKDRGMNFKISALYEMF
jgi:hypothetical protein